MSLPIMPTIRTQREYTIPQLHFVTIVLTAIILVFLFFLYQFSAPSKEGLYISTIGGMVGFLTGKLSNSFGKPVITATMTSVEPSGPAVTQESASEN